MRPPSGITHRRDGRGTVCVTCVTTAVPAAGLPAAVIVSSRSPLIGLAAVTRRLAGLRPVNGLGSI